MTSERTTGNDPVEGLDPGGARPTKPGTPDKSTDKAGTPPRTEHTVESGDRNDRPPQR